MNMEFKRKLPIPKEIKEMFPLGEVYEKKRIYFDGEIKAILDGRDDRFLLLMGPCSADNEEAVIDYLCRLRKVQEKVKSRLLIVPRIYTNKPRTKGTGYKGMLHQPNPHGVEDMLQGITTIRKTYIRAAHETEFFCADELLYPENYRYLSDVLAYAAVGARSVENQFHRLTASGLDVAVGMKNPTSGDLAVLINSLVAAQSPHTFIYRNWEVESKGNPYAHAIVRGYTNREGKSIANYDYEELLVLYNMYMEAELKNPAIVVDANHDNSAKNYLEQIRIAKEVISCRRENSDIAKIVKGLMIESYLVDGNQPAGGTTYGQSLTDPCLGWEKSERLVYELAEMV